MKLNSTAIKHRIRFSGISLLLMLCSSFAFSQIQGTVLDETGSPMIAVSVSVKGTTKGTSTDLDGKYKIDAQANQTLVYSFVGYLNKEISVGAQKTIDVTLDLDDQLLSEVVVVGYGSQLKREVTGSVQTLGYKELKDLPVSQVGQKLQGQLAGVQINQTTGKPGQGMNIRIRGQVSVSAGSNPLYVIDGFPITGDIGSLNPDEIEEITILKDAASTSLYGSRAANGVVLITTKKGKPGTNVSFNAYTGIQTVPQRGRIEMMDAVEFAQFKKEYYTDAGQEVPVEFQNPSDYEGKNNDWYDALLRNAPMQSYTLNVTSNKADSRTAVVAGVFDQEGVVINNKYQRYSLRINSEFDVSDKVKVGFNIAPQYVYDNTPRTDGDRGTGILFNALHTWPVMPIRDETGELTLSNKFPGSTGNIFDYANWVRAADELVNETTTTNLLSNAYLQYEPIKNLVLKSTFNVEMLRSKFFYFNPSTATSRINVPIPTTAQSIRQNVESLSWLNENLATYTKSVKDHNFELLAGFTNQKFTEESTRITADTYADDRIPTIQGAININRGGTYNGVGEWSLTSLLSRLTYNYKGKYLFTAAVRRDGSSRFGSENRWGTFPSVSAGWVMSDETFLADVEQLSFAKLRASFGVIGNNNIGNYTSYALINNTVNGVFGSTVAPGAVVTSLANNNLGWETTKQFDIGLDLGLFNDRIQFIYDFYTKRTTNLLYSVQIPQESGFGNFNDNIGEIKFWGHEFSVNTKNLNASKKLSWNTNFNLSLNRNKVMSLADGIDRVYGLFHITQVGQPFGQFYGHVAQGVYQNQADLDSNPQVPGRSTIGSIKLTDQNGDGIITNGGDFDDRVIMGNPFPTFTYGITNNFRYKNWDLSIVGSGSHGNQLLVRHLYSTANLDGVFNMVKEVQYRFRSEENPGKGFYGTTVGGGNVTGIERDWMNSRFIADASYFTIKNITLGHTFNKANKIFSSARLYTSVQQAFVFTKYWGGPNPETSAQRDGQGDGGNLSPGVDLSNYPVPRTFTLGLNLNF
ncbi:SusC/RagA family TonB-linked outer membrane protein [Arcticibacterium luteifluviistationis]|uniref:SusC/RagA family TonB-linked outer membrane protein n=2 Tax=Arcticibacterium luteifluviistationis TaxID=1784714 RepID=A0A2Z4GGW0_9BACT|nr:TonB-dependent receptor [Arcticibacterium luteifluviistationis]AWW00318.1 SusC/RagA family TonB-linked outer membrane protein [Arcticibacterium luteifluviistationis]